MKYGKPADSSQNGMTPGLRWMWLRYRGAYFAWALAAVVLRTLPGAESSDWPNNTFVVLGMLTALFGGVFVVGRQLENRTVAFFATKPVSRRHIFNILVLAGLIPWLVLLLAEAPYTVMKGLARPTLNPAVPYLLLYVVWSLAQYFFIVCIEVRGYYDNRTNDKAHRFSAFLAFFGGLSLGFGMEQYSG